jgi:hypothetical protein
MADIPSALRAQVREDANGRCGYGLIPETAVFGPHEVDHIIALKHDGQTTLDNLVLCCRLCNRHKGTDIASIDAETGLLQALFHPRLDQWTDHFQRNPDGVLVARTAAARVTIQLLRLNRPERIAEREALLGKGSLPT